MISFWNISALLFCIVNISKGDILRLKACNKFYALFDVVYENSLLSNTVYSSVENISLHRSLIMCIQYPKCKSFSYMSYYSQCRMHHSSSVDNGTALEEVIGWVHYETSKFDHNLGPICYKKKPCQFGRCVDTCDSKGYKCIECKGSWTLLKRNACFGARANMFATFTVPNDAVITDMKVVHVGGPGVTCYTGAIPTKWGCDGTNHYVVENIGVVITDDQDNTLYPSMAHHVNYGYFTIPGYNANSPFLVFSEASHTVYKGQELRLQYGEVVYDGNLSNNGGESCADIYAIMCDK